MPSIPGVSCPSAASALASAGLGPVCQVTSGITSAAGSAVSQVAGFGVNSVLDALSSWVSAGATWLLTQIGGVLGATTSVDLTASWFVSHYATMAALSGVVVVPLLLLGIIQSIYRQDGSTLVRSVLVNVPLALLLTAVAVKLVELGLAVTDAMSAAVAKGAGLDAGHFMASVTLGLTGASATGQPDAPGFLLFLGSLAVVFGAVMVWVELLLRSAAVYVTVLFLPLALASLAWPAISHWCRRLVDTLVALILGKFVIVTVLSLAAGALAGSGGSGSGGGGGFTAVLGGAALLLLSAFSPWALFRLLPFLESGAVGHLEGLSQRARRNVSAPVKSLAQVAMRATAAGSMASAAGAAAGGIGAAAGRLGRSGPGSGSTGQAGAGATTGPGRGAGRRGPGRYGAGHPGAGGGPDAGHDMGPSSAESTGVGTTEPPGGGIPMHPVHAEASAAAQEMMAELERAGQFAPGADHRPDPGRAPDPSRPSSSLATAPGPDGPTPLPRQTGTVHPDSLGRDALGIRLIGARQPPSGPPPSGPPRAGGADTADPDLHADG